MWEVTFGVEAVSMQFSTVKYRNEEGVGEAMLL